MKSTIPTFRAAALIIAISLGAYGVNTLHAATVEGFETFVPVQGTNVDGDASVRSPNYFGIVPTELTHELLLTTISNVAGHDTAPPTNQSGTNADTNANNGTFLGVTSTLIRDGTTVGQEGSAFKIDLGILSAGSTITFNYDFLTADSQSKDFAYYTLTGLTGVTVLYDTLGSLSPTSGAGNPFNLESGFQTATINILTTQDYVLGVGVSDGTNTQGPSGLLVDNIAVNPVPEPSTVALVIAGAVSCLAMRRRLKS